MCIEGSNPSPSAKIQEAENDKFSASFALEFDHVSFSSIAYLNPRLTRY